MSNNVSKVNKTRLCHGCGVCFSVCPAEAIIMKNDGLNNYPSVDERKCTSCGLCLQVCSGININCERSMSFKQLDCEEKYYMGYSDNSELRQKAASGGVITQILTSLMSSGEIEGAVIATPGNQLEQINAVLVEDVEQIKGCSSTIYYPVSSCAVIKKLSPSKRYVFVGKGCDLDSLSRLQKVHPWLSKSIHAKVGLMCHHTPFAKATVELLKTHGFDDVNKCSIRYRENGWPGKTAISDGNREVRLEYSQSWGKHLGLSRNMPFRCMCCTNGMAGHADIVVGDAWKLKQSNDNSVKGTSLIVCRTQNGESILKRFKTSGQLHLDEVKYGFVTECQSNLIAKNTKASYCLLLLRLLNSNVNFENSFSQQCSNIRPRDFFTIRGIKNQLSAIKAIYMYKIGKFDC